MTTNERQSRRRTPVKNKLIILIVMMGVSLGLFFYALALDPKAVSWDLPKGKQAVLLLGSLSFAVVGTFYSMRTTARYLSASRKEVPDNAAEQLESRFASIVERLEILETREALIRPEVHRELVDELISKIKVNAADQFLETLQEQVQSKVDDLTRDRNLRLRLTRSTERLGEEIDDLKRRGLTNLLAGMCITALGVIALAAMLLFTPDAGLSPWQFFSHYVPRLTLIILIEIFAYFFLRLYKANLQDIKYFQNEITNIESKHVALQAIFLAKEPSLLADVVSSISKTERNRILEKGQSTVEIERAKLEHDEIVELVKATATAIGSVKGKAQSRGKDKKSTE